MLIKKKSGKRYKRDEIKTVKRFAFIPTCVYDKKCNYVWVWLEVYNKELQCACFDEGFGFHLWDCVGKYRLK